MSKQEVTIQAKKRESKSNVARQAGFIPAVIYGHGIENENVVIDEKELKKALELAGLTTLVKLKVDKKEYNVLIREVQRHVVRDNIMHVDFYQVRMDEKVHADVPLIFIGESPAVKNLNGVFVRNMDTIEVEALPIDLPHDIKIDISSIDEFDKAIHVKDLQLPENVEVSRELDEIIALVQPPRTAEEIEKLSEEVEEDVEGVEGVISETDEEEDGAEQKEEVEDTEEEKKEE